MKMCRKWKGKDFGTIVLEMSVDYIREDIQLDSFWYHLECTLLPLDNYCRERGAKEQIWAHTEIVTRFLFTESTLFKKRRKS